MHLTILYEDNHLIAVEKPPGILIQGDISGEISLLDHVKTYIKEKHKKPGRVFLGLVHRLDKPVSGAVLFARTSKAARRLHGEFFAHKVEKLYIARTHNPPETSSFNKSRDWVQLNHKLYRKRDRTLIAEHSSKNTDEAILWYKVIVSDKH